jgi:hypothetical protein
VRKDVTNDKSRKSRPPFDANISCSSDLRSDKRPSGSPGVENHGEIHRLEQLASNHHIDKSTQKSEMTEN